MPGEVPDNCGDATGSAPAHCRQQVLAALDNVDFTNGRFAAGAAARLVCGVFVGTAFILPAILSSAPTRKVVPSWNDTRGVGPLPRPGTPGPATTGRSVLGG
jgi:hypothetical protein